MDIKDVPNLEDLDGLEDFKVINFDINSYILGVCKKIAFEKGITVNKLMNDSLIEFIAKYEKKKRTEAYPKKQLEHHH